MSVAIRSKPTALSLCAGIGGLDLGTQLAFGSRTICYVEREAFAASLLVARMEDSSLDSAPIWDDLKTFDGKPWRGRVDLISAGYPCQPFSCAGKGLGDKDPRHLWPDVARIIGEVQPRAVVLENVQGHVNKGLQEVLETLSELGYDAGWGVYSAAQAGAPHRRNRVFILAYCHRRGLPVEWTTLNHYRGDAPRHDTNGRLPGMADAHSNGRHSREPEPSEWSGETSPDGGSGEVADTIGLSGQRWGEPGVIPSTSTEVGSQVPQFDPANRGIEDVADSGSQRPQGYEPAGTEEGSVGRSRRADPFPPGPEDDWSAVEEALFPATESSVRGVADGSAGRVDRLRALGNGVVPQQAALAILHIMSRLRDTN